MGWESPSHLWKTLFRVQPVSWLYCHHESVGVVMDGMVQSWGRMGGAWGVDAWPPWGGSQRVAWRGSVGCHWTHWVIIPAPAPQSKSVDECLIPQCPLVLCWCANVNMNPLITASIVDQTTYSISGVGHLVGLQLPSVPASRDNESWGPTSSWRPEIPTLITLLWNMLKIYFERKAAWSRFCWNLPWGYLPLKIIISGK